MLQGRDAAFVVRIWVEQREIEGARPLWRGVVEHAQSGERKYLTDLGAIVEFIAPYLRAMEEDGGRQGRRWLRWPQRAATLWRHDATHDDA